MGRIGRAHGWTQSRIPPTRGLIITASFELDPFDIRRESGLDRLDSTLFALMILSRTARSAAAFGGPRSLTRSSTRTTSIQAIKAATPISLNCIDRRRVEEPQWTVISVTPLRLLQFS